jgi:DNA-binding transcriptional ArsR family regulator
MARYRREDLSEEAFGMISDRFKALSEPMRLRLLYSLMEGEKTVTELVEETGGLQANVSKHLRLLLETGMVERRKQGLNSYYRIEDPVIHELCDLMCDSIRSRLETNLGSFLKKT